MAELSERADKLKGFPEKGADNMLKISSDARKASLDMRLVKADAPFNPTGKVNMACNKITEIYKDKFNMDNKGTQLVFLDLGTPKAKEKVDETKPAGVQDDDEETVEEQKLLKDVYANIKAQLIANGVAEKDIAFIHEAKNDKQRLAMQDKVNSGDILVLI